jgi:hypothetical protein
MGHPQLMSSHDAPGVTQQQQTRLAVTKELHRPMPPIAALSAARHAIQCQQSGMQYSCTACGWHALNHRRQVQPCAQWQWLKNKMAVYVFRTAIHCRRWTLPSPCSDGRYVAPPPASWASLAAATPSAMVLVAICTPKQRSLAALYSLARSTRSPLGTM